MCHSRAGGNPRSRPHVIPAQAGIRVPVLMSFPRRRESTFLSSCHSRAGGNPRSCPHVIPAQAGIHVLIRAPRRGRRPRRPTPVPRNADKAGGPGRPALRLLSFPRRRESTFSFALLVGADDPGGTLLCRVTPTRLAGRVVPPYGFCHSHPGGIPRSCPHVIPAQAGIHATRSASPRRGVHKRHWGAPAAPSLLYREA
jgi:hypothetical protein